MRGLIIWGVGLAGAFALGWVLLRKWENETLNFEVQRILTEAGPRDAPVFSRSVLVRDYYLQ